MTYIVWLDNGRTALRTKDGRVVPSTKRMSLFTKRDAIRLAARQHAAGKQATVRKASPAEVAWASGGYRTGSDWRTTK